MSFSPPFLFGGELQFRSEAQLLWFWQHEIAENRLTVLSDGSLTLFDECVASVRLAGASIGSMRAMPVHQESDVLGLQLTRFDLDDGVQHMLQMKAAAKQTPTATTQDLSKFGEGEAHAKDADKQPVEKPAPARKVVSTEDGETIDSPTKHPATEAVSAKSSIDSSEQHIAKGEYGGLLLERYGDQDYEGFQVSQPPDTVAPVKSDKASREATDLTHATAASNSTVGVAQEGAFQAVDVLKPLDDSSLIGMLIRLQNRCDRGELTLRSSQGLWTLYTDRSGRLCFDEDTYEQMQRVLQRRRAGSGNQTKNQTAQLRETVVLLLTELSQQAQLQFRYLPSGASVAATNRVPFTVYICEVLLNLLKLYRLETLKSHYANRLEHFVESHPDATISAADYALFRRGARFFEIIAAEEHSLRILLKVSPASNGETYRLLRLGELLNLLSFSRQKLTHEDLSQEHLSYLQQQFSRAQEGYFEALGAHMVTHPKLYQECLNTIKKTYARDCNYALHSFRHRELCAQMIRLGEAAFEYLSNRNRRVAYRKKTVDATVLRQAADVLLEKADMNRLRGNDGLMREALEMALELDPQLTRLHVQKQRDHGEIDLDQLN